MLHSCFSLSKFFKSYDVFFRQKCETFSRSSEAVFELATRFAAPYEPDTTLSADKQLDLKRLLFHELTQVSLWGNATDLSLLINMTEEDIKRLQASGSESLAASEKNIIGNHMDKVWEYVSSPKFGGDKKGGRFDFVMDNAGFELYSDLVYADWLMQSGLASEVRFHGKRFAWFVSDVTDADFKWLINQMVYGHLFTDASDVDVEALRTMGNRWKDYVAQGKWIYEQHPFWSESTPWLSRLPLTSENANSRLPVLQSPAGLSGTSRLKRLTCSTTSPNQTSSSSRATSTVSPDLAATLTPSALPLITSASFLQTAS